MKKNFYTQSNIELIKNKHTKNIASPFINHKKTWESEESFQIPQDLIKNIEDVLGFIKPSTIQSVAIPLIATEPYHSLIAQAKNGTGKTGAFAIGTSLRIDRDSPETQVLVLANTRELVNQIYEVYVKLLTGTGITITNFNTEYKPQQIIVGTHGKIQLLINGRKPLNLSQLKCVVIDEADFFFHDDNNFNCIQQIKNYKHLKDNINLQWILFSATYPKDEDQGKYEQVQQRMVKILDKAQQIRVQTEQLKLSHVKQFVLKCQHGKKLEFIKEVFETCEMTQTFIFVNSKNFAEKIHQILQQSGFHSFIMFSKMTKEERDITIEKFRSQKINVLITTNIIARGIDVPETQLVINYDVPTARFFQDGKYESDPETYLHRIGRTGRFGAPGIALTLWDRETDKQILDDIIQYYDMGDSVNELEGPDHLKELLRQLNQ